MQRTPSLVRLLAGGAILAGVVLLAGFVVTGSCHIGGVFGTRRLATCTSPTTRFSVSVPPSSNGAQLLLGLPQRSGTGKPPPFRGEVVVRRGTQELLRFPVVSWKSEACNWLESEGQAQSYLLTNGRTLGDALKPGETYDVTVTFAHPPPNSASLWLAWTE